MHNDAKVPGASSALITKQTDMEKATVPCLVWADTQGGRIITLQAQVQISQESKTATEWCVVITSSSLHEGAEQLQIDKGAKPGGLPLLG